MTGTHRVDDAAEALDDEDGRRLVGERVLADGFHAHRHELARLLFGA